MQQESKKVSIIIPCYNQSKYVEEAINSALSQTYKNTEIICINDGSTDESAQVIENCAKNNQKIIFINQKENKGVVTARNTAIEAATGEYILPLDADDTIEPTYVEKAARILDANPQIGIVYCRARLFGAQTGEWKLPEFDPKEIIYTNSIFCCSLFRKSDFEKAGGYKEYMHHGYEDWDLWLSFLEHGLKVYRLDEFLFNYRKYKEHSRTNTCKNHMPEIYKNIVKHHTGLFLATDSFIEKVFKSSYKKLKKYRKLFAISIALNLVFVLLICASLIYIAGAK